MTYKSFGSWGLWIIGFVLVALNEWVMLGAFLATTYLTACTFMPKD